MKLCLQLLTLASFIIPCFTPSNADACQETPVLTDIRFSDGGEGLPDCLDIEAFSGHSTASAAPYMAFENGCDEVFQLDEVDGLGLINSLTLEPGEAGNLTTGFESRDSTQFSLVSVSWKLGEGEESPSQMEIESYVPDWDTCGCNHHSGRSRLPPLALMLLGAVGVMALLKRHSSL